MHAIGLRWYLGLHPLTWLGVHSFLSQLIVLSAWLFWAAYTAFWWWLLWTIQAWLTRGWFIWILGPVIWCGGLWLFSQTPFGLPWWTPGTIMALFPGLPKVALNETIDTTIISWVALFIVSNKKHFRFYQWFRILPLSALVLFFILTDYLLPLPPMGIRTPQGSTIHLIEHFQWSQPILLVQGNLPVAEVRQAFWLQRLGPTRYLRALNMQQPLPKGSLWIFPEEGALPGVVPLISPDSHAQLHIYQSWVDRYKQFLIMGTTTQDTHNRLYNSLILLSPKQALQVWHKRVLVPFGETAPLGLGQLMQNLLDYKPDFSPGAKTTQQPFHLSWRNQRLIIWPLLCSEAMYLDLWPNRTRTMLQTQSTSGELVVISANLGWFQQSSNPILEKQWWHIIKTHAHQRNLSALVVGNLGPTGLIY